MVHTIGNVAGGGVHHGLRSCAYHVGISGAVDRDPAKLIAAQISKQAAKRKSDRSDIERSIVYERGRLNGSGREIVEGQRARLRNRVGERCVAKGVRRRQR